MVTTELDKNESYDWDEMVVEKNNRSKSLEVKEEEPRKSVAQEFVLSLILEELDEIIGSMKEAVSINLD